MSSQVTLKKTIQYNLPSYRQNVVLILKLNSAPLFFFFAFLCSLFHLFVSITSKFQLFYYYELFPQDPTDHSTCMVFYFEGGYVLGSITNDNMDRFIGTYTCTVGHPDVTYTDQAKTQISECGKLNPQLTAFN